MPTNEQLNSVLQEQAKLLLDSQLSNLSERLFEVGKKADQQLAGWLTFSALTVLLGFGAPEAVSLAGVQLKTGVAAAVAYGLSCAFYYRAVLSMAALQIWRESLRERRKLRFDVLLHFAKAQGPAVETDTVRDINGFVSEYPGYLACSVLVKDESLRKGGARGKFIEFVHKLIILIFAVSPYLLAGCVLYAVEFSWLYVALIACGMMVTLSANAVLRRDDA